MGTETSKASLFDKHLVSDLINKVKGHSSLAKLSSQNLFRLTDLKNLRLH